MCGIMQVVIMVGLKEEATAPLSKASWLLYRSVKPRERVRKEV